MQFTELGSELPDEALTLRSRHVIIDDDEGPLPIKSTVGMVLDGLTVSMTIPGLLHMFTPIFRANALTIMRGPGSPASRYVIFFADMKFF
jgi:hypothetical protein